MAGRGLGLWGGLGCKRVKGFGIGVVGLECGCEWSVECMWVGLGRAEDWDVYGVGVEVV